MGVLDDIKAGLSGPTGPQEVVVETPLGNIPSSLDKMFEQLTYEARKKKALEEAAKTAARDASIRGAGGAPYEPPAQVSPPNIATPPPGWGGPTIGPISREKVEQSPEYTADLMRKSGGVTIGPFRGPGGAEYAPIIAPGTEMSEGTMAGRQAAKEDDWSDVGRLAPVGQFIDRLIGNVNAGAGRTARALASLTDSLSRITGMEKGGMFDDWSKNQEFIADYFRAKSGAVSGTNQKEIGGFGRIVADVGGSLLWDIPQIMAIPQYGLAVHGAAYGLAEGGVVGMIKGGVTGALTHGIFQGIALLPTAARMPTAAGVGGFMSAVEGGNATDIATGAATWAILTGKGGPETSLKEFKSRYSTPPAVKAGIEGYKTSRMVQRIETSGITRQEFLGKYDQMKHLISEDVARDIILEWNPNATAADIAKAGGAKELLDKAVASAKQVIEKSEKFNAAVGNIVAKMSDEQLDRTRGEMQSPRPVDDVDNPAQRRIWSDTIDAEIAKRVPRPIDPTEFAVEQPAPKPPTGEAGPVMQDWAGREVDRLGKLADKTMEEEGGAPFVFNSGAILKTDAQGRGVGGGPVPLGQKYFDDLARGNTPAGDIIVNPPGSKVIATSKNAAGQIVEKPLSGKDRVERLMIMVPYLKPQTTANGYIRIQVPNHPFADAYGTVALHRIVWEQYHNKRVAPWEEVHHKNEDITDNRPENLELQPTKEAHQAVHAGRTPTELESSFPLNFDRSLNPKPQTEAEKKDQEDLLNGLTTVAGLGYKYSDIVPPERGRPGRPAPSPGLERGGAAEPQALLAYPGPPPDRLIKSVTKRGLRYVEPARKSTIENDGSTFNSTMGDMGMKDYYVSGIIPEARVKYPGNDVPAQIMEKFWKDNAELIASDPQHLGVGTWFNKKDGMTHIDVVATIHANENGKAAVDYLGRKYKQIEVTYLKDFSGWNTGGDGESIDPNWMPPIERMFDPELRRIMGEKPKAEPGPEGAPPVEAPPSGALPPDIPPTPAAPKASAETVPSGDPVVQLLDALQSPGLTVRTTEQGSSFRERSEKWLTNWLDRFYPVHKYSKVAGKLLQGMNPSLMIRAGWLSGVTGRAEALIFKGGFKTDIYGKNVRTGEKPLKEIFAPHSGDMPGFDKYLVSRAAIEEEALNRFRKPEDWVNTGVDLNEAQAYVTANAAKYDVQAKEFTKYFHARLSELSESGLIDPQFAADLRSKRPNYAPLRRDLELLGDALEAGGSKGIKATLDKVTSPLRERLGSDKPILPPTQSAIIMTYEITNAVLRQQVAKATVDLRKQFGMEDIITQVHPGPKGEIPTGPDIVMVRNAGKPEYFKVPQDLADSMKMIHEVGLGEWVKKLSIPSRWLRTGATAAPGFSVRNPIRDWQTAFINSKSGFNPITDFTKGLFHLITKDDMYWKWKESGAEWSMLVTLDKEMAAEAVREMKAETSTGLEAFKARWLKSPLAYLEKLSELGEKPTRIGVFERSLKTKYGMSDMEAAAESRSASTDFATRGSKTKAISALYTFLNARAQTTYKMAQTATEHPGQFMIRGIASAAVPTILLYALNRDDPDYWKRDAKERRMFWFLPMVIGGRQVKIPKGEVGIIFGNAVELALEAMDGVPEGRMKVSEFLESVFQTMSPIGNKGETLPTFARPIAEWVNNKKYYSDTAIENEEDQKKAPYLRYGPHTSETVKAVGQAMGAFNGGAGVSPKKIENTLYGYTGGVGRMTLGLVDWLAAKAGILPDNPKPKDPRSNPVTGGFLSQRSVGFESEPARMFYAAAESVQQTKKTIESITKRVVGADEASKGEWIKSHPEDMKRINQELKTWIENHPNEMELLRLQKKLGADLFTEGRSELASLRKLENSIASDSTMDAEAKRKALDIVDKRVSAIVDPVWKLLNAASSRKKTSPEPRGK